MSPRAAWRLERFGFQVFDYAAGKVDWLAAGLPTVRSTPAPLRAHDAADRVPPTSAPTTPIGSLGAKSVIVVNDHGIVLGRVPAGDRSQAVGTAEAAMEPGPATVRAHEPLDELLLHMQSRNVSEMIVSTPEGRLLGVVRAP